MYGVCFFERGKRKFVTTAISQSRLYNGKKGKEIYTRDNKIAASIALWILGYRVLYFVRVLAIGFTNKESCFFLSRFQSGWVWALAARGRNTKGKNVDRFETPVVFLGKGQ